MFKILKDIFIQIYYINTLVSIERFKKILKKHKEYKFKIIINNKFTKTVYYENNNFYSETENEIVIIEKFYGIDKVVINNVYKL